ncbi:MAG: cytochrome P450 [Pseudonocardia sp.]
MAGTRGVRRMLRWGVRHGMMRALALPRARQGEFGARIVFDPVLATDPFDLYEEVRARGRLVDTGLAFATADHALSVAVLRSPDFRTAASTPPTLPAPLRWAVRAGGRGSLGPVEPPSMLAMNPPDHTRYRKLVNRAFSARAIAALRTRTEEIAEELLDGMAAHGPRTDLVADYASLLPATVIAEMLGAPVRMREQFLRWGASGAVSLDVGIPYRDFRASELAIDQFHRWMLGHFARVRAGGSSSGSGDGSSGGSADDIITTLVAAHDAGQLTEDELSSIAMLLLAAGFETTVNLIGNGVVQLARRPEQLATLRSHPELWPVAVDEVLRYDSPVQRTARIAVRDTEVGGVHVPADRVVMLLLGGANRDPGVFADPQRFDVTRTDAAEHIAFSSGVHYCLGAGLARMEGEVGLRALFRRFPELTLAGEPTRRPTRVLRGYDDVPVRLQPASVSA